MRHWLRIGARWGMSTLLRLNSNYNYAGLLLEQGKREEALEQYRLELEGVRRVHGENHPSTQQSLRNYQRLLGEK